MQYLTFPKPTKKSKKQKDTEDRDRDDIFKGHVATRDDCTCLLCGYQGIVNLWIHHLIYKSHKRYGAMTPQHEAMYACCLCTDCHNKIHAAGGVKLQQILVKKIKKDYPHIWRQLEGAEIEEFVNRRDAKVEAIGRPEKSEIRSE